MSKTVEPQITLDFDPMRCKAYWLYTLSNGARALQFSREDVDNRRLTEASRVRLSPRLPILSERSVHAN